MAKFETMSVALTEDMVDAMRAAVARGDYVSTDEVVGDALSAWFDQRAQRETLLSVLASQLDEAARNPIRLSDDEVSRYFDERHPLTQKAS